MKTYLLSIGLVLSLVFNLQAQMTPCDNVVYDTFDTDGALPSDWTEYNTSGRVTVVDGVLTFNHNSSKPSVYRTFDAVSENVTFTFDVKASRNSVTCPISLVSSTGEYIAAFVVATSLQYASEISDNVPGSYTTFSSSVTFIKDTYYSVAIQVNFTDQTVDFYVNGVLKAEDIPFLESTTDVAKIDIKINYMWSDTGYFYFDNIALSTAYEGRLQLYYDILDAETLLASAVIGEEEGNYSQEAYDELESKINVAKSAEESCSATDAQIDYIISYLETAVSDFEDSQVEFTKYVLIDAEDTQQKILMIGGDMERNAAALQSAPNKQEIIDWLFKDIDFNCYRVKYDKSQEMTEGDLDLDGAYGDQVLTMQMILEANPDIEFFAVMKSDYHGYSQGNRNNLPTFIYDYAYDATSETYVGTKSFDEKKYAGFLADYLEYMSDNNVPITYLSTSKEWTAVVTADRAKLTIEYLKDTLALRGVDMPLIIDPSSWSLSNGYKTMTNYVANGANDYVYGYGIHNYYSSDTKTWSDIVEYANSIDKVIINDESGHGSGGPTNGIDPLEMPITTAIKVYSNKCDMYDAGYEGELIFEMWMNNFNYARPIMFSSTEDGIRIRTYYIIKQFVNHMADATYVKQSLTNFVNVNSMAFVKDNSMAFWMINESTESCDDCYIEVSNFDLKEGMTIEHMYWDSTSVITGVEKDIIAVEDDRFVANLTPRSINCFVISPYSIENAELLSNDDHMASEEQVSIYPNPTSGQLTVNTDQAIVSLSIFDMNGRQVYQQNASDKQIDISSLRNGVYFLSAETNNQTHHVKIVKD